MNKSILHSAITAAMAISIAACSSGSDVAGIGGSGVTPSAVNHPAPLPVLAVCMSMASNLIPAARLSVSMTTRVLKVISLLACVLPSAAPSIDDSNGTATSISFNDDLEGPVSNIQTLNIDTTRTLTILGRQVVIDSTTTSFDISGYSARNF